MSIVNATIAGGTRRMLQDVMAWHNAKSHDITRVNAMVAAGLVPKDAAGNPQIPSEVLDGLWRPFPGSPPTTVNITSMSSDSGQSQPSQPAATPSSPSPAAQGPVNSGSASPAPVASGFNWAKAATIAAALLGGAGGAGGLGYWLGVLGGAAAPAPTASTSPATSPNYLVPQTQYELRIGKRQAAQSTATTPASE